MAKLDKDLIQCHGSKIELLEKIIHGGKIPHAFLFTGPRGIGKSSVAYLFAKMVLSIGAHAPKEEANSQEIDLFGEISPKKLEIKAGVDPAISEKVNNGRHSDLFILNMAAEEDKKNIGIDEVRGLGKFLSLTPAESKYRVALIDSIDDFNLNSANAILKMLEEPTRNTVLIIVCHSKANLLPTIKSRTHEINFKPLTKKEFIIILSEAGHENEKLEDIYELSEGSPGLALEIIRNNVNELVEKYFGIINKKVVNIAELSALAKEIKDKESWDVFGKLLLKRYSDKVKAKFREDKNSSIKYLNNYSELNEIIYFSDLRNMDIQDSLKFITNKINNI